MRRIMAATSNRRRVVVSPSDNIQTLVDASPTGTTFFLRAGTYNQSVTPKSSDVFQGQLASDGTRLVVFDGQGSLSRAFLANGATNGRIQSLQITNYTSSGIDTRTPSSSGWIIEDCEVSYCNTGIRVSRNSVVWGCHVHHNRIYGLTGDQENLRVEDCELSFNRTDETADSGNSGCTKFVLTDDLILRGNFVHHNFGNGLWVDINNIRSTIENNTVEDNKGIGIFWEISYGGVVRNNVVSRNGLGSSGAFGGAGINITNSPDVEVTGNTLADNTAGIVGRQWDHPGDADPPPANHEWQHGDRWLKNLSVHNNDIKMTSLWTGIDRQDEQNIYDAAHNNKFFSNTYRTDGANRQFWDDRVMGPAEWQSFGQDLDGVWLSI